MLNIAFEQHVYINYDIDDKAEKIIWLSCYIMEPTDSCSIETFIKIH